MVIHIVIKINHKLFDNKCMILYNSIWVGVVLLYIFLSSYYLFQFEIYYLFWFWFNRFLLSVIMSLTTWCYCFWIDIGYLPLPYIYILTLSKYFYIYFFLLTNCYKFRIFIQISQCSFNFIVFAVILYWVISFYIDDYQISSHFLLLLSQLLLWNHNF